MLVRRLSFGVLAVAAAAAAFLAYRMDRGGPALTAQLHGSRWHIAGRFLGEYSLGFERVKIVGATSRALICEFVGRTAADIDLVQGVNTPAMMFGEGAKSVSLQSSQICELQSGQTYEVTAWGNNGSGKVRPSSIQVRM